MKIIPINAEPMVLSTLIRLSEPKMIKGATTETAMPRI
jgi:hypothetical protein